MMNPREAHSASLVSYPKNRYEVLVTFSVAVFVTGILYLGWCAYTAPLDETHT